jgi:hypothetical protein
MPFTGHLRRRSRGRLMQLAQRQLVQAMQLVLVGLDLWTQVTSWTWCLCLTSCNHANLPLTKGD